MSAQEPLVGPTTEDSPPSVNKKYQSSEIITAAQTLKFQQKSKAAKKSGADKGPDGDDEGDAYQEINIQNAQEKSKDELCNMWKDGRKMEEGGFEGQGFVTDVKKGLTSEGVAKSFELFGENALKPAPQLPWWAKLLLAIFGGEFNILLWFGSVLCFFAYIASPTDPANLYLGVVLAVVVTITGVFGYYQESKSSDIMESFKSFEGTGVVTYRNGNAETLQPVELVPGDLVQLKAGDKIPADIRITECSADCTVNNSSLTGEADPQERNAHESKEVPLEAKNMCFFGTLMMKGSCKGIVVATGDESFMGTVAKLAQQTENVETPIAKEIKDFVHKVSAIAFVIGAAFFIIGMVTKGGFLNNVIFLIGIIVANVPEGLLATVTVSLTLTANRMGAKAVQVKNLESVETLGSTSVICSDKTGTLTTSIMTVQHVYYDTTIQKCDTHRPWSATREKGGAKFFDGNGNMTPSFARLVRIGALCNNAQETTKAGSKARKVAGDATESAVYKFCEGHICKQWNEVNTKVYREQFPKHHEIPFNSKNKWQVSIHAEIKGPQCTDPDGEFERRPVVVLKGAPEKVLEMCDRYLFEGEEQELTDEVKDQIMKDVLHLGSMGERVLGFADANLSPEEYDLTVDEPMLPPCKTGEVGSKNNPNCVYVEFEGEEHEVELKKTDKNGNTMNVDDHRGMDVYTAFAEKLQNDGRAIDYAVLRICYGNHDGKTIEMKSRLGDLKIHQGSLLRCVTGPYKFQGSSQEEANWPFAKEDGKGGLVFVGLYAMIDPARAGVPEAVSKCQDAGIKVIMVTGDHPVTAHAIAKKVGIINKDEEGHYHLTKQDIAKLDYGDENRIDDVKIDDPRYRAALVPGQKSKHTIPGWTVQEKEAGGAKDPASLVKFWNEVLTKESIVFARTSPEQKLKIVQACRERGGVVAVTGDGVNDSPALKRADIGVAMGITGTEVAKDAADMILKDDNFASIVNGVEEGRIIFDNLKKSIAYTLSSNIPEITPFLVYQLFSVPLPLGTVMILLVDLGTDLAPAISMAHEGAESDIMQRAPRKQNVDKLVTMRLISFSYLQIGCIQALAGFYAYFVVLWAYGLHPNMLIGADRDSLFSGAVVEFPGTSGTPSGEIMQRDGFWMYCWDPSEPCHYAPDPSNFLCFWDDSVYDNDAANAIAANDLNDANTAACVASVTPRDKDDHSKYYSAFGSWKDASTKDAEWSHKFQDKLLEIMDAAIDNGGGMAARVTELKSAWTTSVNERVLFRTYVELLYTVVPDFTYNPYNVYKTRDCHSDTSDLGSKFSSSQGACDQIQKNFAPEDWAFWKTNNRECTMLMPCHKDLDFTEGGFSQGQTVGSTPGRGMLFPMQMHDRVTALAQSNTAYFISIIVVQWADLMICKTRSRSLFEQTMTNVFMNYSLFFETVLGAFLVYVPVANTVCTTKPLRFVWWTSAIPFSIFIYTYDELRKGYIRANRGCWLERNTYW